MGTGASAAHSGWESALSQARIEDVTVALASLPVEQRQRLLHVLPSGMMDTRASFEHMVKFRPTWLPSSGPGNLNVPPEQWAMTIRQWVAFVMACKMCTKEWSELEANAHRKESGYVNMYQLCDCFIKPWTKNLGNSVALLMNNTQPLEASVMISHAWGASVMETMSALLGQASIAGMTLDTAIWFCTFAVYQPGDTEGDCGPGIASQLDRNPFANLIRSKPCFGMVVIHTRTAEVYERLWCVFEVNEAQRASVSTTATASIPYVAKVTSGECQSHADTQLATCSDMNDKRMITDKIMAGGGFQRLNEAISDFRKDLNKVMNDMVGRYTMASNRSTGTGMEHLTEMVLGAALFVGLHCLNGFSESTRSVEQKDLMIQHTKDALRMMSVGFERYWQCDIKQAIDQQLFVLSGTFDYVKLVAPPDVKNDNVVLDCLRDLRAFPLAIGFLEMGAGGAKMCLMSTFMEVAMLLGPNRSVHELRNNAMKEIFKTYDADSDGLLDEQELAAFFTQLGMPKLNIDLMVERLDTNQNGKIDYDKFVAWMSSDIASTEPSSYTVPRRNTKSKDGRTAESIVRESSKESSRNAEISDVHKSATNSAQKNLQGYATLFDGEPSPEVAQRCRELIEGEKYTLRSIAAQKLGNIGAPEATVAIKVICLALKNDTESGVRLNAALALGSIVNPDLDIAADYASQALRQASSDPHLGVRQKAKEALTKLGYD